MVANYYFFPIDGDDVLISILGDSNKELDTFAPLCVRNLELEHRRLSYVNVAGDLLNPFYNSLDDLMRARITLTEVHQVFTSENGVSILNVYLTFNADLANPLFYWRKIKIGDGCLDEWKTDEHTKRLLESELERMKENYDRMSEVR